MAEDVVIRLFHPDDFSAVCELEQGEKGSAYSAAVFVRQASVLFGPMFFVAVSGKVVVGYAIGGVPQAAPMEGWILRLRVSDHYHRRSFGRNLLSTLLSAFAQRKVHRILLTVAPANHPARTLYKGMGFEETGFLPGYFGPEEDRLILSADISSPGIRRE